MFGIRSNVNQLLLLSVLALSDWSDAGRPLVGGLEWSCCSAPLTGERGHRGHRWSPGVEKVQMELHGLRTQQLHLTWRADRRSGGQEDLRPANTSVSSQINENLSRTFSPTRSGPGWDLNYSFCILISIVIKQCNISVFLYFFMKDGKCVYAVFKNSKI